MWSFLRGWRRRRLSQEDLATINRVRSDIRHLQETLARGSQMRKQTPEERAAIPTTFGYAHFPLTDPERAWINWRIEFLQIHVRHIENGIRGGIPEDEWPPLPPGFDNSPKRCG